MVESLNEAQRRSYLVDGYIAVQPANLGPADHRLLYDRADALYRLSAAVDSPTAHLDILGDNLRPRIPELDSLLADPAIDGALTDLLGPDYLVHPHCYCHRSGRRDQVFHQDGNLPWNERGHHRSHRPDWAMVFYYPQAVDLGNGPTEVVPGTQYWTVDHEKPGGGWHPDDRIDRSIDDAVFGGDDLQRRDRLQVEGLERGIGVPDLERRFLQLPAGTVVIAHYDLIHRGSRVAGGPQPRYMYKFYCARIHEPSPGRHWAFDLTGSMRAELVPVVEAQQRWLQGIPPAAASSGDIDSADLGRLAEDLRRGREDEKVAAAYRLGRVGAAGNRVARELLAAALFDDTESVRRAAAHGLRQIGPPALEALLAGIGAESAPVRRVAASALGIAAGARPRQAVEQLIQVLSADPDDLVRSNAAYSLGQLSRTTGPLAGAGGTAGPLAGADNTAGPLAGAGNTAELDGAEFDAQPIADALLDRLAPGAEPDNAFGAGFARSTVRQSAAFALVPLVANHRLSDDAAGRLIDGLLVETDRYVEGLLVEALARADHLAPALRRRLVRYLAGRRWNRSPSAA